MQRSNIATAKFGNGIALDGSDDFLNYSTNILFDDSFTIEAWIYINGTGGEDGDNPIFVQREQDNDAGDEAIILLVNTTDYLRFYLRNPDGNAEVYSTAPIQRNTWIHVAALLNSSDLALFIDGSLNNTVSHSFTDDFFPKIDVSTVATSESS